MAGTSYLLHWPRKFCFAQNQLSTHSDVGFQLSRFGHIARPFVGIAILLLFSLSHRLYATDKSDPKTVFPIDTSWLSPLFVDVRVNGSEPMRFIVDSASTYSMIRKADAEKLGLKTAESETLNGGGGSFRLDFATADLDIGGLKLKHIRLGVGDLSPAYAGIVGGDFFENFVVSIDFEKGKVSVFDPVAFKRDPNAIRVPVNIRSRIPSVEASLTFAGKTVVGEFRVDTASGRPMTLHNPFAEKNSFPPPGAPTQSSQSAALGGHAQWVLARADAIQIGDLRFEHPLVEAFATSRGAGGGTVLAGMIGNEILRRFRVTFDCPHRDMFFEPNAMRNMTFEVDMSGLGFGPSFRIFSVTQGSVAEKAGLKVGDVITKLDGKDVSEFGLARAHDQLMRNGAKCEVEVRRGNTILTVQLDLRRVL